jgi:ABC-type glycerol-3-phosphate transport system substrate-binding protein
LSKRLIVLLAGVLALAGIVAGCGSSSDDSTEATVALTKVEFVKQGDAICTKGTEQIETEAEEFAKDNNVDTNSPSKEDEEEVIVTVVGPALQTQADELRELGAPKGEEDKAGAIFDALEAGAEELENDPASLLEGTSSSALEKAKKLAVAFGFKKCGQG